MLVELSWVEIRYDTRCYFNVRSKADITQLNLPHGKMRDTWTKLVSTGNTEARNGYYVTNDVTVGRRLFCLHTLGIFREDKMSDLVEMHVFLDFIILESGLPRSHPRHFSKLIFFSKIWNFTAQVSVYQEGRKLNTEVNEQVMKNVSMHRIYGTIHFTEYQFASA